MDKIIKPLNQLLNSELSNNSDKYTRSGFEDIESDGGEF